jgi:enoyl-CoA hydratase
MSELPLRYEVSDGVAVVTLNRPEARNAISPEVACRMADAFTEAAGDENVRVVILTGAGESAFCSGGDLALTLPLLTGARTPQDAWDRRLLDDPEVMRRSALRDWEFDKPIIAALNGHCMAGGMETALACDIRIAVEGALLALPEVKRGLIPFAGAVARLPRYVPHGLAMEILLTGDPVDAERALAIGLVNRVVSAEALMPTAWKMARSIAANGPVAVRTVKAVARKSFGRPLEEGFRLEDAAKAAIMATEDAREGPRAFMEKRPARFTGR